MLMNNEILSILDRLPKYIRYKNGDIFSLVIYKNDWDGHDESWIIMYSKDNKKSLSTVNTILKVNATDFYNALVKMEGKIDNYRMENKGNPNVLRM